MGVRIFALPLMWGFISFICFQTLTKDQPQSTALHLGDYCAETVTDEDLMDVQSFICLPQNQPAFLAPLSTHAVTDLQKSEILKDYRGRISSNFQISERIYPRVEFWFDVYTKYESSIKLIHHEDYPWIIFKVVDTTNEELKKRSPIRYEIISDLQVNKEVRQLKADFLLLSKWASRKNQKELPADLSELDRKVEDLPGATLAKKFKILVSKIRVQTGQKNFFAEGLVRSQDLLPEMERMFMSYRLPIELTRLPFVESSFNHLATSKVGAAGLWQIMPHIAKHFFRGPSKIDQRRLVLPSTKVAAQILKENYMLLKDWGLAVTAYNHGPGGIRRALKKLGSRDIEEIVDLYETARFSFASQNFYSEFLAALYAQMYSEQLFREVPVEVASQNLSLDIAANEKSAAVNNQ